MTKPLSNLFVGSSEASSVSQALNLNRPTVAVPNNSSSSDRFWASEKHFINDTTQEVLEMNFSTASLTNRISFDVSRFPSTITIQYTRDSGNNWLPVIDPVTSNPISLEILRSFPAILPSPNTVEGHNHPQHDYDGHWERLQFNVAPDEMQKIRFIIQRNPNGQPPLDSSGNAISYSVALQNIYIGYEISSENDIPRSILEDGSPANEKVFANSADVFGSNIGFAKKTNFANSILFNTDASAPLIWKSEPQPFPRAVVNFYADLRDKTGDGQIIDRIFIDPLYDGSHVTLYYSNDAVGGEFVSSRKALTTTQASFSNAGINSAGNINLGNYGDASFLQVNNGYISFDPSQPWWIGIEFTLGFSQSADGNDHILFGCGSFQIGFNSTGVFLKTISNDTNLLAVSLDSTNPIQLIGAYHNGMLHLSVQQSGIVTTSDITASVNIGSNLPAQIFIGTDITNTKFANSVISAFILKQESWIDDSFLQGPSKFSKIPRFQTGSDVASKNALLRFDSSLISNTSATGMVGGPAFNYENMSWTPIPREYELHRGNMQLPPTKAKFWNLEITNLRAEVNEKFIPVERTVKTFPPEVIQQFSDNDGDRSSVDDMGTNVQISLANSMSFNDAPTQIGTGQTDTGFTTTEVYVSEDYETQLRLRTLGNEWKYRQWHPDRTSPRFNKVGKHNYTISNIRQTSNISYYTGLRQIQFSRTVKSSPQDHSFIEESFTDGTGVNQGNWYIPAGGGLYSGTNRSSSYARTTSVLIPTQRPIRGIQFASQQTDNKQINTNGEFSDPSYSPSQVTNWSSQGDGKILGLTQPLSGGDTALLVSRQTNQGFWGDISINYVTWGGLAVGKGYQSSTDSVTFPTTSSTSVLTHQGIQQTSIQVQSADGTINYVLGTDYSLSATNGSNPNSVTTIGIVSTGSIPTSTAINVLYNYADSSHPTAVSYRDLSVGLQAPSFTGGIQSSPIPLPPGGKVHAAARVTATQSLTQPLWIQIIDADSGGILAEQQSNVGKNEVKEWYTSVDIKDFGGKVGITWGDLIGKKIWSSWSDNFQRADSSSLGFFTSGQSWNTPSGGTSLSVASSAAKAVSTGNRSEVDTGTPWGTLDVTIGTAVTTATHSAAVPVIDLGGWLMMNDSTIESTNISATLLTMTTALANGVRYRFKFMPTSIVPAGQQVAGADPTVRPYSLLVFTRNNDTPTATETWVQTYSGTRSFGTVRALMGAANQTFTYFAWNPSPVQINLVNQQLALPVPQTSQLVDSGTGSIFWDQLPTKRWEYAGAFTYSTVLNATAASSLAPGGAFTIPGTMAVVDVKDQYGSMDFNVTQVASGLATSQQAIAYLNYNPVSGKILTLQADGTILLSAGYYDPINNPGSTVKTSMFASATAGPIAVRYISAQTLSSSFKTTWSIGVNDTQAIVVLQSNAVVGVYSGIGIWDTTVRGVGGANNGNSAGQYTIIEGFSWNPDASLLATNTSNVTWGNVTYGGTRTYDQLSLTTRASVQNIIIRLIQKTPTLDYWFTQSVALFWEPVVWAFSCDGGLTFWNSGDIRNNPRGIMIFPNRLTNYNNLVWRVTSYSGDVTINNLTIRPVYQGMSQGIPPRPTQLPLGPNLVPSDHYGPIDRDPKWMVWNKPIPRTWWFNFKKTISNQ